MEYNDSDIKNIASILSGSKSIDIPEEIYLDESNLYEICLDLKIEADFWYQELNIYKEIEMLLLLCAQNGKFEEFINYYLEIYLDKYASILTEKGYNFLLIKNDIQRHINSLWSIPNKQFAYKNGKWKIDNVKFKEYDKLGEGGFSTVYKSNPPTEPPIVYKVLSETEKSNTSSVHRFRREYDIMQRHNKSGCTIKVYDFDATKLVYSMEYSEISLEEYIETRRIKEREKEDIIRRCVECMMYLHDNNVIHRDFHPGNILLNTDKQWVVTDFGLAKDITDKYSRQTTTTHAIGRFWFTDPIQLETLKEGSFSTDMYSLARTIDYIMNENKSGKAHKYSSIIYKAINPDINLRYQNIHEMYNEIIAIINRPVYISPEEVVGDIIKNYKKTYQYDETTLIDIFSREDKGKFLWELAVNFGDSFANPYLKILNTNYKIALDSIKEANEFMQSTYKNWNDYDTFANWAYSVLKYRKDVHDDINIQIAKSIEYVAGTVNRFSIMSLCNKIKKDNSIDNHIRAIVSSYDGY